ncbi:MAG: glycosyltransferase family 9 protein [Chthoniobacterales bacterium]
MNSPNKKWALTCPDGIGDFLFRIPWIQAMESEGWELLLIARAPTIETANLAGLKFTAHELSKNPYEKSVKLSRHPFIAEKQALRKFDPSIIFLGPSQPTYLEDILSQSRLPGKTWGFSLKNSVWFGESISTPEEISKRLDKRVAIEASDSEPKRNSKAAEALLKKTLLHTAFHFQNFSDYDNRGEGRIAVCAGRREGDYFSGWGDANWITALRFFEAEGVKFVFLGSASEADSHKVIHAGLQNPTLHTDLTGDISSLSNLLAILNTCTGFVGKDGGILHLCSALKKPTVAVFGGGHWGRFLPQGTRAVVLSVRTPCRGCDWRCHLPRPLCVEPLSPESILNVWKKILPFGSEETLVLEQELGAQEMEEYIKNSHQKYVTLAHEHKRFGAKTQQILHRLPWPLRAWAEKDRRYG